MARRLAHVAVLAALLAVAACASPTSPTHDCTDGGGTSTGSGNCM